MKKEKESRWQREQKERKKERGLRAVKKVFLVIFLIFFLGLGWRLVGFFKNSQWDGYHRLNLVLKIEPVTLASFDPSSQTIKFLKISDGTFIEAADGHGPCRVEKIFSLGELENQGMALLSKSLETYLGLPVDGWLMAEKDWTQDEPKNFLVSLIKKALLKREASNLSTWDLLRLWLMTNRIRSHKIEVVDLAETTVSEDFLLPDGTQAKRIDDQRVSRIINRLFADEKIRQENLALGVMNASGQTGLAAQGEKLITNIGGRLVEVGNWPEELTDCLLKTNPLTKETYTVRKLAQIFRCQIVTDLSGGERWDLLLILGKDSW